MDLLMVNVTTNTFIKIKWIIPRQNLYVHTYMPINSVRSGVGLTKFKWVLVKKLTESKFN